ncbi:hypothetical protein [Psychrobacillus sp. L3]
MKITTSKEVHERFKKELIENVPKEFLVKLMTEIDKFNLKVARKNNKM